MKYDFCISMVRYLQILTMKSSPLDSVLPLTLIHDREQHKRNRRQMDQKTKTFQNVFQNLTGQHT